MDDSTMVELTGKIMVIAIIVLFFVLLFVFFLHLYAKWFWYSSDEVGTTTTTRRRRRLPFNFSHGQEEELSATTLLHNGLDPSLLKSIPIVKFTPKDFKEGLECPVCLSELAAGEKFRLLPKCNHGFHVECIDMWFQSHSTCPLCRNPVSNSNQSSSSNTTETSLEEILENQRAEENSSSVNRYLNNSTESSRNFPTNVLFWGNESQVSTLGACLEEEEQDHHHHHTIIVSHMIPSSSSSSDSTSNRGDEALVIEIPRQMNEEDDDDDDMKSPVPTRMRSFKRFLSRDRRVNPCSNVDLEQLGSGQS
ncbi:hypothetical protein LguiA_028880 [Lonicera macranthoides]